MKRKSLIIMLGITVVLTVAACGRQAQSVQTVKQAETAEQMETAKQTETAEQPETAKQTETAEQAETAKQTETAEQPETVKQTETAEQTEEAKSMEASKQTEAEISQSQPSQAQAVEPQTAEIQIQDEPEGLTVEEISEIPASYREVIERYAAAMKEGLSGASLAADGLNPLAADCSCSSPSGTIGYAVTDLDQDGQQELVIAAAADVADEFYKKLVLDLYTLDSNGASVAVFSSGKRNRYYYAGENRFANLGSSGAADSFETTVKLEEGELIDMTYTTQASDYVQMELNSLEQYISDGNVDPSYNETDGNTDSTSSETGASGSDMPEQGWNSVILYDGNLDGIEVTRGMDESGNWYDLAGRSYGNLDMADSNAPVYREDGAVYYWNTDLAAQAGAGSSTGQDASASVNDPYDLYSWDAGTNSYIPYQAADSSGDAIGRGNGWYYYDAQQGTYLPW